jgi:DHA2 family multidrug resistance protein
VALDVLEFGVDYASAGFAMLFAALDQAERLDWWRSGLFTSLVVGGLLFLLAAFLRRLRSPNPLVDLQFLLRRNTLLGALVLIFFRFALLSTIILVPQSLAIHGFEAKQIGPAVIWIAAPQIVIACVAGLLLSRNLDSRMLMALGFACIAFASSINAAFTSVWSAENFFRSELLMAVGQSFAFIGVVSTLVLQGLLTGGLLKPQSALTFSAFTHLIRILGGQAGVSFMTHFIAQREKFHSNLLGLHVQHGNWITDGGVGGLAAGLSSKASDVAAATARALGIVNDRIRLQAYTLAFSDAFHLVAWGCVLALLLIALLRKSALSYGDLGRFQQGPVTAQDIKS